MIGSNEFLKFHKSIIDLLETSKLNVVYVLRHNYVPLSDLSSENKVTLSGYGVELDIKSTEYKAKDDAKVNADTSSESTTDQTANNVEEESIQGFNFKKLKQLNPNLNTHLEDFKVHLQDSQLEMTPLKAWEMQDLSLQAAQQILEAEPSDALHVLEDLAQNFPLRARLLSKIRVKKDLAKIFKAQRQILESSMNMEPGVGALYLNGLEVNMDTMDIFSLNALLKKESKLIEGLHQIGLTAEKLKDLVYLDTSSKNTVYGVDIRDTSIMWLNNLEKDSKYNGWSKGVQEILRPTYPGMMRSIAKNFFNLVFVLDPAKEESKTLLKTAESFYVNDLPVRIGFVFVTNNQMETDGFKEANVALFRAYNYVKTKTGSAYKALAFITDVIF
jgi:UDP-glucose:glycoprotein glucosyltransferase